MAFSSPTSVIVLLLISQRYLLKKNVLNIFNAVSSSYYNIVMYKRASLANKQIIKQYRRQTLVACVMHSVGAVRK